MAEITTVSDVLPITDLKLRVVAVQTLIWFGIDGFFDPGDEVSSSVLHMPPDDLDHVDPGTIWRQIGQAGLVFDKHTIDWSDRCCDECLVKHHHDGLVIALLDQADEKLDDIGSLDAVGTRHDGQGILPKSSTPSTERLQRVLGSTQ